MDFQPILRPFFAVFGSFCGVETPEKGVRCVCLEGRKEKGGLNRVYPVSASRSGRVRLAFGVNSVAGWFGVEPSLGETRGGGRVNAVAGVGRREVRWGEKRFALGGGEIWYDNRHFMTQWSYTL